MESKPIDRSGRGATLAAVGFFVVAVLVVLLTRGSQWFCENTWSVPAPAQILAARVAAKGLASAVTDDELRGAVESVRARAAAGDTEAAAFLFELASLQRATTKPSSGQ